MQDTLTLQNVLLDASAGIATLTVNRPKALNALDLQTLRDLEAAVRAVAADEQIRCVILTGAGERAFVAGADIAALTNMSAPEALAFADYGHQVMDLIDGLGKPVIAAVNGFALGGGCELALACDFIYAAESASLGLPEVTLGVIPGFGGTQRLTRRVGPGRARELIFSGERMTAQRAKEIGLVNEVCVAAELMAKVRAVAETICKRAPVAVRQAKRAIRMGADLPMSAACELERQTFAALFATDDVREGTQAFLEKRAPSFKGK